MVQGVSEELKKWCYEQALQSFGMNLPDNYTERIKKVAIRAQSILNVIATLRTPKDETAMAWIKYLSENSIKIKDRKYNVKENKNESEKAL